MDKPIQNIYSSNSNFSSPQKSHSSLGVTLYKQDSKNFTVIVYDNKNHNNDKSNNKATENGGEETEKFNK